MTEELASNIVITFANIRKMAVGLDFGNSCETTSFLNRCDVCTELALQSYVLNS